MPAKKPVIVYRYTTEPDHYECIAPVGRGDMRKINRFYAGKSVLKGWKPFTVKLDSKKKAGDFPALFGFIPVFSERAWETLRHLIEGEVEALPIIHPSGKAYFAINVLDVVDALDLKKSKPKYYANGPVMGIEQYWFKERLIRNKHMFRVPETSGLDVLVSGEFKKIVEAQQLRGIRFAQVYPPLSRVARMAEIKALRLP